MKIQVKIGDDERDYTDRENSWILEQIRRRRAEGDRVCVQVKIEAEGIQMTLFTVDCLIAGGNGQLTQREKEVYERWRKLHLNEKEFTGGQLIAFLRQISH